MKQALLIFIGGGLGSIARFVIGKLLNNYSGNSLPYGTLTVNILGSFLIGIFMGMAIKNNAMSQNQILFLIVGFCGGFTTFSTFAYENIIFLKSGDWFHFLIYTIASFVLGLLAVLVGMYIVRN